MPESVGRRGEGRACSCRPAEPIGTANAKAYEMAPAHRSILRAQADKSVPAIANRPATRYLRERLSFRLCVSADFVGLFPECRGDHLALQRVAAACTAPKRLLLCRLVPSS